MVPIRRSKKLAMVVGGLVLVPIVATVAVGRWGSAPRAEFQTTEIIHPRCRPGDAFPLSVTIRNAGSGTLRLAIASVSCACTNVRLGTTELGPGETTELTGKTRANTSSGTFSTTISVASNDPDRPETEVVVRGEVDPYISVWPATLTLRPTLSERAVAPLRLRNTDANPVTFSVSVRGVSIQPSRSQLVLASGESGVVDFICQNDVVQYQNGHVHLVTSHPGQQSILVPAVVAPEAGLELYPPRFSLGVVSRSELLRQPLTVAIRGKLAKSGAIAKVEPPAFLKLESREEDADTGEKKLVLSFSDSLAIGTFQGSIALNIDLSGLPLQSTRVMVPVTGVAAN